MLRKGRLSPDLKGDQVPLVFTDGVVHIWHKLSNWNCSKSSLTAKNSTMISIGISCKMVWIEEKHGIQIHSLSLFHKLCINYASPAVVTLKCSFVSPVKPPLAGANHHNVV